MLYAHGVVIHVGFKFNRYSSGRETSAYILQLFAYLWYLINNKEHVTICILFLLQFVKLFNERIILRSYLICETIYSRLKYMVQI